MSHTVVEGGLGVLSPLGRSKARPTFLENFRALEPPKTVF